MQRCGGHDNDSDNRRRHGAHRNDELAEKDDRTMSAWIELTLKRAIEEVKRKK